MIKWSLIIIIFLVLLNPTTLKPQNEQKEAQKIPMYTLKWNIPAKVTNVYKLTEATTVTRQFSDSSVKKYRREYSMFFTQTAGDTRKDGFLTAEVSVDSLFYKFTEGDAVYEFNSQAENPGALTFEDLKAVSVPLGKFFDMKFSPYDEVVAVEGEKLDWFRNYVVEQGRGYLDTATSFMWLDGISIERLKYITDVKKLIFPTEPQFIDSLWFSPFHFQIEGLNFSDTVGAKVTQVIDGYKTIEVKNIKLKPYPQTGRFYGIKGMLLSVESAKSNGSFMLSLTPKGSVRRAEGTFETELTSRVRKDKFTEKVSVNAVWELLGQFIN